MESFEETALLSNEDMSKDELGREAFEAFWKRVAVTMLLASVLIQLGLGATILVFALKERTIGGLGLGVDIILDVITTLVVIWKYLFRNDERRYRGINFLSRQTMEPQVLLPLESAISVTFGILMIGKIYLAKKLESKSLFVDGINTGCGLVMAVMNLVSLLVFRKTNLWFIDSVSSVIISLFLFFFGLRLLLTSLQPKARKDNEL